MKQHFKGYYRCSEEEIRALWSSAIIVFDANVLLDFHRYEPETSATYLGLASAFSERLWVPFQAVQEYHENRPGVRAGATSAHDDQIDSITDVHNLHTPLAGHTRDERPVLGASGSSYLIKTMEGKSR